MDSENTFFPVSKFGWSQCFREITAIVADFWPNMVVSDVRGTDTFERLIFIDDRTAQEWEDMDGDIPDDIAHRVLDILYCDGHECLTIVHDGSTQRHMIQSIKKRLE